MTAKQIPYEAAQNGRKKHARERNAPSIAGMSPDELGVELESDQEHIDNEDELADDVQRAERRMGHCP
jgi:hypothetical protein